jgi:hypothetical protein
MRRDLYSAALACAGILFLQACSDSKSTSGVTEGGNTGAIAGIVLDSSGNPVKNALVRLRPTSYVSNVNSTQIALLKISSTIDSAQDTLAILDAYSDQNGKYYLDSVPVGDYSLETRYVDPSTNQVLVTWRAASLMEQKPLELSPDTLRKPATVRGSIPDSLLQLGYCYVQVIGLDRIEEVDEETGDFEIDELPPGVFQIRFVTSDEKSEPARIVHLDLDEDEQEELGEVEGDEEDDEEDDISQDSSEVDTDTSAAEEEEEESEYTTG